MKTIARKRMVRELKKNAFRYLALFLLIAFGMYLIISMVASADNITIAEEQSSKEYKREDGQFDVFVPLSEEKLKRLENDGITIEPMFYMDFKIEGERDATKGAKELAKGISDLEKNTRRLMNETFSLEIKNMTSFLKAADNPRIAGAVDDVVINKYAGIIAGVIVIILFTFVISVFVIHGIEQENTVIGALYALGVEKKELMVQYLLFPVCITLLGGIVGTLIGFSDLGMVQHEQNTIAYFSLHLIAVGGIISIYISKAVMDAMYPYLVSNVAAGMDLH